MGNFARSELHRPSGRKETRTVNTILQKVETLMFDAAVPQPHAQDVEKSMGKGIKKVQRAKHRHVSTANHEDGFFF